MTIQITPSSGAEVGLRPLPPFRPPVLRDAVAARAAAQAFADGLKLDVRMADWVSCSDSFLLGLNMVAKRRIWLDWLEMADKLFSGFPGESGATIGTR